jgi:hypothetical protein
MRLYPCIVCVVLLHIFAPSSTWPQDRVLIVQVTDPQDRPVSGVILSTKGEGAVGAPTDIAGRTKIKLARSTAVDSLVSLQLVRMLDGRDLVFMSPWDGRVRVPPFESDSENFVAIVLIARQVRRSLEGSGTLSASVLSSIPETKVANPHLKKNAPSREPKE